MCDFIIQLKILIIAGIGNIINKVFVN